ncbi:iron-containing redox enzyme family protein [Actinosynnema sp. NPDC023658]|uniref:iron-containing redox enzyme family protein n=1 Tax=Actinosynnema sp. NPDC023658 TaxID=3155465 RepID=UPI0033FFFC43
MTNTVVTEKHPEFKQEVDALLREMVERFYREVEGADHLYRAKDINLDYYKRHIVEIILRLRMKRWIDALTIHYFTKHNPVLAKKWCAYTEDEMLHDSLFAKDLERVGVSKEEIYSTEPLFTTKLLQGYFYYGLEHEGRPLASLASSYFIENVSLMTQPQWIENVEDVLGSGMAKGQQAHVDHDLEDDHTDFVWNVLMTFVETEDDKRRIVEHITNVYKLFCAFYLELYQRTVKGGVEDGPLLEVLARP